MICTKCEENFHPTPTQCRALCKVCTRSYNNAYYAKNKKRREAVWKSTQNRISKMLLEISDYKRQASCKFCKESEPVCLDLHHLDPTNKDATVSRMVSDNRPAQLIWREVSKCIVVCKNCHSKVHAGLLHCSN
jgi:hypothetical protein